MTFDKESEAKLADIYGDPASPLVDAARVEACEHIESLRSDKKRLESEVEDLKRKVSNLESSLRRSKSKEAWIF